MTMAMDNDNEIDIEALLEAPFESLKKVTKPIDTPKVAKQEPSETSETITEPVRNATESSSTKVIEDSRKRSRSRSRSRSRKVSREHRRRYSRSRSRSPTRESGYRSRSPSRGSRYRSRSPRRSSRYSPERSRHSRDRYRRRSDYSRSPDDRRSRSRLRSPSPRRRSPSPEPIAVVDPQERDRRTVFCQQLAARLTNRDLAEFLSPCGRIREAKIVMSKGRSKGVAYVEFYSDESVPKAILMTGQKLLGIPIICSASEAYKNAEVEQRDIANGINPRERSERVPPPMMPVRKDIITRRLVIGNLAQTVTENDIRSLFDACGRIDSVKIHFDSAGRSKGFGFVTFRTTNDAHFAVKKLHMYNLKGKLIDVKPVEEETTRTKDLDDDDVQGVALTTTSRVELMSKLARDEVLTTTSRGETTVVPAVSKIPRSPCIILKNMFDSEDKSTPNWEQELREDVEAECEKFGKIYHIAIDPNSKGFIYIKFSSRHAAEDAIKALDGRFFGGKQVTAVHISEDDYLRLYPKAALARP